MDLLLKEKVVFVTGSSHGLGRAIAKGFLEEEAKVVVTGLTEERTKKTVNEFNLDFDADRILSFVGDLTKRENIKKCVDNVISRFRRIDILIANLGSGKGSTDWNVSEEDWSKMMDLNLNGARRITNEVVPYMINNKCGSVVYISSIAGLEVIGAPIHYSVAKTALIAFSKNLSWKLAKDNIRVNTVCPGNIYFKNGTWDYKMKEKKEKVIEMLENKVPLKRFSSPEEIADIVLFLASERASFITGACIIADGGQTISV